MVMVTAGGTEEVESRARAAGAADVVLKPVDVLDLVARYRRGEFHAA
jgi:DNA-binding response OmpR family regulator